jgi:2-polyprenyl-3-methyl-5-hydroxy-6-metoxy-1,4-benzoquinol methylase
MRRARRHAPPDGEAEVTESDSLTMAVGMSWTAVFPARHCIRATSRVPTPLRGDGRRETCERYGHAVKEYYEELWERLPKDLEPPDQGPRRRFALASVSAGERVLDLGCGTGDLAAALAGTGADVVAADVAQAALARAHGRHPGLELRKLEIDGELPFADGAFDVVWSSEVIEHVADTARWLSEVRRVLAPTGRVLLTTPNHGRVRLLVGGIERYSEPLGDHLHLYTARSLRALLKDFAFGEISVRAAAGPPLARRLLLARAVR